ncbi:MmcB family DNA repair protein, partial [Pseudorhodoplanes sp.]
MSELIRRISELPVDGRQSQTALTVARGTMRLLLSHGFTCVSELPL